MPNSGLTTYEVFKVLRPEQVDAISNVAEQISMKAGDTVYRQGDQADRIYAVLEGQVALRLPRQDGVSLLIEELTGGSLFGSCVCFDLPHYALTALCTEDCRLLSIDAATLKRLMEEDLSMGHAVQTLLSRTYFQRYINAMRNLQAIVQALPLEAE
ncbi:MAG: cyclic nucleotide-binding domain-containing protein [Candidatus Eiseniibacteriota bacterium]|jgi:CRP-like cAMP-binding protein